MLLFFKLQKYRNERGFTLLELLVVISIFSAISVITIANLPKFSSKVEFDNQALELALDIREAQVYGMGVREDSTNFGQFKSGRGIFIEKSSADHYIVFEDRNNNGRFDVDAREQTGGDIFFKEGFNIIDICLDYICNTSSSVNIVFKRPNPDALIYPAGYFAVIKLQSSSGDTRDVTVTSTGQIYVNQI